MAEIKEQIVWKFADKLRPVIPFYGFSSSAIELIFIKYLSNISFQEEYKNMFLSKKLDINLINKTLKSVENTFIIDSNLLNIVLEDLIKIFTDKEEYIFTVLNDFEIPNNSFEMTKLIELIISYGENKDVSKTELSSTNTSLIELVNKILDVKENETYMDSFAGFSISSLKINAKRYLGYEINSKVAAIANIIMILTGKDNFSIRNQSYYLVDSHCIADKVFSDGPITGTLSIDEYHLLGKQSKKVEYYNVKKSVESIKPNGKAVVTCTAGVLFRNDLKKLREQLTLKNLSAAIALPPLWKGTTIPTNLLVFKNERQGDNIVMIDASANDYIYKIDKRIIMLTGETIEKIIDSLNGNTIEGFSSIVSSKTILNESQDCSWAPTQYIKKKNNVCFRPSKEIKEELDKAYDDLSKLLKK